MSTASKWQARVIERSVERAAASPGDRRSRDSIARRALKPTTRIVEAAVQLAEEARSASFTVQEVLLRADVSLQTFYRHFPGKDELLLAVLEEQVCTGTGRYRQEASRYRDPVARVEWIVRAPILQRWNGALAPLVVREHLRLMEHYAHEVREADEPYRTLLREAIQDAQGTGRFRGVDAGEEAELIMALILARYHNLVLGGVDRSAEEEAEHVWRFTSAALARYENSAERPAARLAKRTAAARRRASQVSTS